MTLSSHQLDAFFETVKQSSFTKAAGTLCITQSALSQRIQQLEIRLGLLFIRGPKSLKLTPLGEELLVYCQKKYALEIEFLNSSHHCDDKKLYGSLKIAAFSTAYRTFILDKLSTFAKNHPAIQLCLAEHELRELPAILLNGTVDYIISTQPLYQKQISIIQIGKEINTLVQAHDFIPAKIPVFLDHDSQDETSVYFLSQQPIPLKHYSRHYLDNIHLIIEGVKKGLGQAVLPYELLNQESTLREVKGAKRISFPLYLMYYKQAYQTKLQEAFLKLLTE